jgi:hypothetical protein
MQTIKHTMYYNELSRLKDDRALVPILKAKGMPLLENLLPSHGTLRWVDSNGARTFIWEYETPVLQPPPAPKQVEIEKAKEPEFTEYVSPIGNRAITFEE